MAVLEGQGVPAGTVSSERWATGKRNTHKNLQDPYIKVCTSTCTQKLMT